MAFSTFQKVAVVSGIVLCVSLLLPKAFLSRGRRPEPPPAPSGKMGRFPPMMHHQMPSDGPASGTHFPRSHLAEAMAKTKGSGGSVGGGGGRGLMGQIIPIYGFGILLYILYILFKLSSKGKTTVEDRKSTTAIHGNPNRKITNYELAQLQEKLRETEEVMEKLINRVGPNYESRAQNVTSEQEKRLLQQLREITRVMKEGKLLDSPSPEKEAEEAPYMEDWEGYPEETYPVYDLSDCVKRRPDTILVDYPDLNQASAEEIAERMGVLEEEEDHLCCENLPVDLDEAGQDFPAQKDKIISFEDQDRILPPSQESECTCCHHEEDDPAIIAENMVFPLDGSREPEETHQYSKEVTTLQIPEAICSPGLAWSASPVASPGSASI
ncbi:protein RIC-3 isoform X2 [Gracilinanus agilis]|uniref:protein RIC-3 isoform X2 n=1 Tax=Gracilinanus agilis TaxID=191870 RepID=UPI001CFEB3A9|nr:protein RIC-3 isoform X2 [Gracilinanus agilis]